MKIDSDHITHFDGNNILFGQCLEWRNYTIEDSNYVSQYFKLKDKMTKELKEKRCNLVIIKNSFINRC